MYWSLCYFVLAGVTTKTVTTDLGVGSSNLSGRAISSRIAHVAKFRALEGRRLGWLIQALLSCIGESGMIASGPCGGRNLSGRRSEPDRVVERPLLLSAPLRSNPVRRDPGPVGSQLQRHDA